MSIKATIQSLFKRLIKRVSADAATNRVSVTNSPTSPYSVSLAEKPQVSGLGPFAATPSFTPLGQSSRLLNITLPAKSVLNISDGSIVAIDGDINALESSRCALEGGFEYDKVYCSSPISLLIKGHNQSYCVVPVSHDDTWTIIKKSAIVSWSGRDFTLRTPNALKSTFLKTTGGGKIVFSGSDQMYEINIESGEQVRVNAHAIIATTATSIITKGIAHEGGGLGLAALARVWKNLAASAVYGKAAAKIMQYMKRPLDTWRHYTAGVYLIISTRATRRCAMYTVKGPGKLLLDNTQ